MWGKIAVMEIMYNTSMQLHFGFVMVWLGIIAFNVAMLQFSLRAGEYVRRARLVMPFSVMAIAALAFTGTVMMAAKQLVFSFENSAMIVLTLGLIILEAKRYKSFRRMRVTGADALVHYRPVGLKLLGIAFAFTMMMALWMLL